MMFSPEGGTMDALWGFVRKANQFVFGENLDFKGFLDLDRPSKHGMKGVSGSESVVQLILGKTRPLLAHSVDSFSQCFKKKSFAVFEC